MFLNMQYVSLDYLLKDFVDLHINEQLYNLYLLDSITICYIIQQSTLESLICQIYNLLFVLNKLLIGRLYSFYCEPFC